MKTNFYDIESIANAFTLCNYQPDKNNIDIYYLVDDEHLTTSPTLQQDLLEEIKKANMKYDGDITLYNLKTEEANNHLAQTFGLSDADDVNNPYSSSSYPQRFRPVCNTDRIYDEKQHPFLMGYNSNSYDTTMLALYLNEVYNIHHQFDETGNVQFTTNFMPTKARYMRSYNDELFSPQFKEYMPSRLKVKYDETTKSYTQPSWQETTYLIRKSMLRTGRHLDVAKLNEKLSKVALKRLLGLLGHQILESENLNVTDKILETKKEFYELIAYNVSDVLGLEKLFLHPHYQAQFSLKKALLKTYPELIYNQQKNKYAPDINETSVRRDRLNIDATSAQFSTLSLCPYGHLTDYPAISYLYPSEEKSKELGIPQRDVLEESKEFFYKHFKQPELREEFDRIYDFYKSFEGKNFNNSTYYMKDYQNTPQYVPYSELKTMKKTNTNLFYYDLEGKPSTCFVNFSIGGIHGAEYNKKLFDKHQKEFEELVQSMDYVKSIYPNPCDLKKAKKILLEDGTEVLSKTFLTSNSTLKNAEYKDILKKKPELFKEKSDGSLKLNPKYAFTTAEIVNHEDFSSYYPWLLILMDAFSNKELGYDRYQEIYNQKAEYGKKMKDPSLTKEEKEEFAIKREGTKLILNSASGAGDATFENSIRINNKVISMRIIGQLFAWRIGQAQTLAGARIPSTNTDGLYSILDEKTNAEILKQESANMGVEIEPELMYFVSKDANSRLEVDIPTGNIIKASSSLSCYHGPKPTQALNHPAILDWAMCEYLIVASTNHNNLSLKQPFNEKIGLSILKSAAKQFSPVKLLQMLQNIIASSRGSHTYIFGTKNGKSEPIILQHYNRVFIMKEETENTMNLQAAHVKKITPATIVKRERDNERLQQHDELALKILESHGVTSEQIEKTHEASLKKLTGIETNWNMLIMNKSLYELTNDEIQTILNNIDIEKYMELLSDSYESNWKNEMENESNEINSTDITDINIKLNTITNSKSTTITNQKTIEELLEFYNNSRIEFKDDYE